MSLPGMNEESSGARGQHADAEASELRSRMPQAAFRGWSALTRASERVMLGMGRGDSCTGSTRRERGRSTRSIRILHTLRMTDPAMRGAGVYRPGRNNLFRQ